MNNQGPRSSYHISLRPIPIVARERPVEGTHSVIYDLAPVPGFDLDAIVQDDKKAIWIPHEESLHTHSASYDYLDQGSNHEDYDPKVRRAIQKNLAMALKVDEDAIELGSVQTLKRGRKTMKVICYATRKKDCLKRAWMMLCNTHEMMREVHASIIGREVGVMVPEVLGKLMHEEGLNYSAAFLSGAIVQHAGPPLNGLIMKTAPNRNLLRALGRNLAGCLADFHVRYTSVLEMLGDSKIDQRRHEKHDEEVAGLLWSNMHNYSLELGFYDPVQDMYNKFGQGIGVDREVITGKGIELRRYDSSYRRLESFVQQMYNRTARASFPVVAHLDPHTGNFLSIEDLDPDFDPREAPLVPMLNKFWIIDLQSIGIDRMWQGDLVDLHEHFARLVFETTKGSPDGPYDYPIEEFQEGYLEVANPLAEKLKVPLRFVPSQECILVIKVLKGINEMYDVLREPGERAERTALYHANRVNGDFKRLQKIPGYSAIIENRLQERELVYGMRECLVEVLAKAHKHNAARALCTGTNWERFYANQDKRLQER